MRKRKPPVTEKTATNFIATLKAALLNPDTLIRATFSGVQRGQTMAWVRLVIRPVLLKGNRHLQFSWFDARQNITKNYADDAIAPALDEALALPFANFLVQTSEGDLQVQITKKGKPIIHRHAPKRPAPQSYDLAHDRAKNLLLQPQDAAPFLQAVGIMTQDGKIKAAMQSKYTQINEFLRLLDETGAFATPPESPLQVVDCGCGNAYLTFAMYHYLTALRGISCEMTGIDTNQRLLDNHAEKVAALGWDHLHFAAMPIEAYRPQIAPDVVLALHACDTATDDAIAQGIRWNSRVIVAVPCCHHHLQAQLSEQAAPAPFAEMMGYGLVKQRMGDLLTDSFRALLLRLHGYRVDVVEFVGTEHTPKNVMLRAVKTQDITPQTADPQLRAEYDALKALWQVTPYLEGLLG